MLCLRFITGCLFARNASILRRYRLAVILPLKLLRNKVSLVDKVHYHNKQRVLEPRILYNIVTLPRLG